MDTAGAAGPDDLVIVGPHGVAVTYAGVGPGRRRIRERDRHGTALAELRWGDDGALLRARVRIPDGTWLEIEPRATTQAPWGLSDRLWHEGAPLTVFAALDYARLTMIPPLAEPARLPPGGGTAVLNLIAALATDQGIPRLAYAGPYPTESLFLALLESFRYEGGAGGDPLGAFMDGDLGWRPAPHERFFTGAGVYVQLRGGIEKVAWHGRTYYRARWQEVTRRAPRRVRDVGGAVVCSLWILDQGVEDHLQLAPDGALLEVMGAPAPGPEVDPIPATVAAGVVAIVAAGSTDALAPFVWQAGRALHLEWGPVERDLLQIDGRCARFSSRILGVAADHIAAARATHERAGAALAVLTELAGLLGDTLRARAQAALLARDEATQLATLTAAPTRDDNDARAITNAVEALLKPGGLPPARTVSK